MLRTRIETDSAARSPEISRRKLPAASLLALASLSLTACQSVTGSSTISQFRIIDASSAPGIDFYDGTTAVAYNLGFGNVTSYIAINPGTYTFAADTTGTRVALASAAGTFAGSAQYTILLGDASAGQQELILKDQSNSAPGGQIALRFLDQATAIGAVDIYLVPTGSLITAVSPILANQAFGANSGYVNVPAGAYKIVVYPTGVTPTATSVAAYTGAVVTYATGAARTILLLDQKLVTTPAVQVITASDYDSPSATS